MRSSSSTPLSQWSNHIPDSRQAKIATEPENLSGSNPADLISALAPIAGRLGAHLFALGVVQCRLACCHNNLAFFGLGGRWGIGLEEES
jgi:hypothetical protein